MRYLESPWAEIAEHGDHLERDHQELASKTGYGLNELRCSVPDSWHGHCEIGHMSEATATLIAAAMRQPA